MRFENGAGPGARPGAGEIDDHERHMEQEHSTAWGGERKPARAAWADRAGDLAAWAMARLVVRTDTWGAYTPPERRGQEYTRRDGSRDKVPSSYTAKGRLTLDRLARHFLGARPEDVVGLHSTSTANTCLAARIDIDAHGPGGNDPAANLNAAFAWYDRLRALGFRPLLHGSNGQGGYHLSALFSEPVPSRLAYEFGQWLTADHARHGLPVRPECFPKQPAIPEGGYGNWLRIIGRHHTRDYWPEVWDGGGWLAGADAVAFVLALAGDAPALARAALPPGPPHAPAAGRPWARARPEGPTAASRAAAYLARLPNLGEGQGRDDVGYQFAAFLVRDLAISDDVALDWLCLWDAGNSPPKGRARLAEIIASAHAYGRRAYGSGRDAEGDRRGGVSVNPTGRPGHYILRAPVEVE
jgi:hypothetical protein